MFWFGTTYDPPEYAPFASLNYPKDRTLKNYYKEVSYGKIDVVTLNMPSAQGWTNVGHLYSYYCNNDNGFGWYPNNAQGLVEDAVKLLDPVIDFSKYAINGEVPNLFVVHAGTGAEWSGDPALIWSHSWDLTSYTGLRPADVTFDGVIVNNYAMMPEVGGDTTGYLGVVRGPYPPTVGVYAHEYGHVLGLPDQYDYGYESDGTDVYSLMAGGSWNRYPNYQIFNGNSPAHLDAWSKYRLGVVTPIVVTSATATLPPAESDGVIYRMDVPNYGISIVQADDRWDLEHAYYYPGPDGSLAGDLYPGRWGVTRFGNDTKPNSSNYYFWAGSAPKFGYSGVTASNIREIGGDILVDLSYVPWSPNGK